MLNIVQFGLAVLDLIQDNKNVEKCIRIAKGTIVAIRIASSSSKMTIC